MHVHESARRIRCGTLVDTRSMTGNKTHVIKIQLWPIIDILYLPLSIQCSVALCFHLLLCWLIAEFICHRNLSCPCRVNLAYLFSKGSVNIFLLLLLFSCSHLLLRLAPDSTGTVLDTPTSWTTYGRPTHICTSYKTSIRILIKVFLCVWLYRASQNTRRALVSSISILHTMGMHAWYACSRLNRWSLVIVKQKNMIIKPTDRPDNAIATQEEENHLQILEQACGVRRGRSRRESCAGAKWQKLALYVVYLILNETSWIHLPWPH